MRIWFLTCLMVLLAASSAHATEPRLVPLPEDHEPEAPWFRLRTVVELGFTAPLSHRIQFGRDGTYFDYVDDGGQDNLFGFARASAEAKFINRHVVIFLIQPLDLQSRVLLREDLVVDELTFPAGTAVDLRYGFPFYRVSYMYDFVRSPRTELAAGASLQLRNATITFASADGELFRARRDVGPVPILKFRFHHLRETGWWFGFEADGFYAPGAILNLRDVDVLGAILDASLRVGVRASERFDTFLNLRYIGGGADGASEQPDDIGDGYTRNWLHLMTVSLGVTYELF
ncbi:MAG: hypothetical protein H0U74_09805 [Bradymonadaceae bacterium]|nr:hypothetical protein [Lujinxingiaceae bacterium]